PQSGRGFLKKRAGPSWECQQEQEDEDGEVPGSPAPLLCPASGFSFGSFGMGWYRQRPGQGLQWLGGINHDGVNTYYASSFRGRVRISRDDGQSSVTLTMNSLKGQDSGSYFSPNTFILANADTADSFDRPHVPSCPQTLPGPALPPLSPPGLVDLSMDTSGGISWWARSCPISRALISFSQTGSGERQSRLKTFKRAKPSLFSVSEIISIPGN
uniref:Uncharacterized protein n=1 Tax=Geospiza parvula TaxID=87175 RepID=A0A8U8BML9_GEOPR